jgi:hypothetical protein
VHLESSDSEVVPEDIKDIVVAPANRHICARGRVELELYKGSKTPRGLDLERRRVVPVCTLLRPLIGHLPPHDVLRHLDEPDLVLLLMIVEVGAVKGVRDELWQNGCDVGLDVVLEINHSCERDAKLLTELLWLGLPNHLRGDLAATLLDSFGTEMLGRILYCSKVIAGTTLGTVCALGEELRQFCEAGLQLAWKVEIILVLAIVGDSICEADGHLKHLACILRLQRRGDSGSELGHSILERLAWMIHVGSCVYTLLLRETIPFKFFLPRPPMKNGVLFGFV